MSAGHIFASASSGRCWRRRLRAANCKGNSRNWPPKSGATPFPENGLSSGCPPLRGGITRPFVPRPGRWKRSGAKSVPITASILRSTPSSSNCWSSSAGSIPVGVTNFILTTWRRWWNNSLKPAPCPSYASLLRYMKSHGLFKRPRRGPVHSPGAQAAERRYEAREVRSYESEYVNGLWHLDFHHGSLRVLRTDGQWAYPILLGILDDHSRLCCHLQWYLAEGARELCHGLAQAFQKRDLPRSILFDNGSAMIAAETEQGLTRLGVLFENTLPFRLIKTESRRLFGARSRAGCCPCSKASSI